MGDPSTEADSRGRGDALGCHGGAGPSALTQSQPAPRSVPLSPQSKSLPDTLLARHDALLIPRRPVQHGAARSSTLGLWCLAAQRFGTDVSERKQECFSERLQFVPGDNTRPHRRTQEKQTALILPRCSGKDCSERISKTKERFPVGFMDKDILLPSLSVPF